MVDLCAILGLAYDLKTVSRAVIDGTVRRNGVPAYFDPPRGLLFRIVNAFFDWIIGLLVMLWPVYPILVYKYLTGQALVIV